MYEKVFEPKKGAKITEDDALPSVTKDSGWKLVDDTDTNVRLTHVKEKNKVLQIPREEFTENFVEVSSH